MQKHFFISSHLSAVYSGFSVPTSETSCSSYFMKTRPGRKAWTQGPNPGPWPRTRAQGLGPGPGPCPGHGPRALAQGSAFRIRHLSDLPFSKNEGSAFRMRHLRVLRLKNEGSAFRMRHLRVLPLKKVRVLLSGCDIYVFCL